MAAEKQDMTFLEHLEELRWHIFRSLIAVFVLAIPAFIFKHVVFDIILLGPGKPDFYTNQLLCRIAEMAGTPSLCINQEPLKLQNISMSGQFTMHLGISFMAGIILAIPYIFYELWTFIKPALYENELRQSRRCFGAAGILFMAGVLFAYYLIVPLSIYFLATYQVSESVENIINFSSYVSTVASIVLTTGLVFELPVLIWLLCSIGVVSSALLRKYRRHAIVLVVAVAAIITPPDVISQIMVSIPLLFLYEAGIIIAERVEKKKLLRNN